MRVMVEEPDQGDVGPGQSARWDAPVELAMGLQLLRASSLTSTRLQLALARRDRRVAMTALDTLAAIDGEIEGLVDRLAAPDAASPELAAIGAWLADEKAAVAADRLNLTCEARGPGLVSPPDRLSYAADEPAAVDRAADQVAGAEAVEPGSMRRWWPLGVVVLMLALVAAGLIIAFERSQDAPGSAGISRLFDGG